MFLPFPPIGLLTVSQKAPPEKEPLPAPADVARGILAAIGSKPPRNSINVYTIAHENAFLAHIETSE